MFCDRCGTRLQEFQRFCPSCGKAAGAVPFMPTQSRLAGHVRLLGFLWLAISAFSLLPGLALFHRGFGWYVPHFPIFLPHLMRAVGGLLLAGAALGLLAGWGLLERQSWARPLAIVLGCFSLLHMPMGTALGIYTLWVLLPASSEYEYRRMSRVA